MFTFGPVGPVRHRRPFGEALATTMHEVSALYGDDVVYQIEIPAEVVVLTRTPARLRTSRRSPGKPVTSSWSTAKPVASIAS